MNAVKSAINIALVEQLRGSARVAASRLAGIRQ